MNEQERARIISEYMRYVVHQRRQVSSRCVVCHEPINGIVTRRYCSARCRKRAHYARRREAGLPDRRFRPAY